MGLGEGVQQRRRRIAHRWLRRLVWRSGSGSGGAVAGVTGAAAEGAAGVVAAAVAVAAAALAFLCLSSVAALAQAMASTIFCVLTAKTMALCF